MYSHILYILFAIFFCALAMPARAAVLYFNPVHTAVGVGGTGTVALFLNPELEHVNAAEAVVAFPSDSIEITNLYTGNSIIPLWVEEPVVRDGAIHFSGIIPNGFSGVREPYISERKSGMVLIIEYRGVVQGSGAFSIEDAHVFLNDGLGTEAFLSIVPGSVVVRQREMEEGALDLSSDTEPPEHFSVYITAYTPIAESPWVAMFSTTDKGSGVAYYEVAEVKEGGAVKWVRTESPYVLSDQTRKHTVLVRAVDYAGNIREGGMTEDAPASGNPPLSRSLSTGILTTVLPVLLVLGIVFLLVLYAFKRRRG